MVMSGEMKKAASTMDDASLSRPIAAMNDASTTQQQWSAVRWLPASMVAWISSVLSRSPRLGQQRPRRDRRAAVARSVVVRTSKTSMAPKCSPTPTRRRAFRVALRWMSRTLNARMRTPTRTVLRISGVRHSSPATSSHGFARMRDPALSSTWPTQSRSMISSTVESP